MKEPAPLRVNIHVELPGHEYFGAVPQPPGLPSFSPEPEELNEWFYGENVRAKTIHKVRLDLAEHLENLVHFHGAVRKPEVTAKPMESMCHDPALKIAAQINGDAVRLAEADGREHPLARRHGRPAT
jgi:hypothetical protein